MVHDAGKLGSFLLLLAAMLLAATAEKTRTFVIQDGIKFNVDRYYGDHNLKPYRVVFWENGRSIFKFDDDGLVRIFEIGPEKYRVVYDSSGGLKRVVLKSSRRRVLEEAEQDGDFEQIGEDTLSGHRRLYPSCDDCVEAWDAVCDQGVPSVCDLVDYGSPLSIEASVAINIMCTTFGDACWASVGEEACDAYCRAEDDDKDEGDDDHEHEGDDDHEHEGDDDDDKHEGDDDHEHEGDDDDDKHEGDGDDDKHEGDDDSDQHEGDGDDDKHEGDDDSDQHGGDDDDDKHEGINACLDPTSDEYRCTFTNSNEIRLEDCGMSEEDAAALPACFKNFGKDNIHNLFLSSNVQPTPNSFTTLPEDVFAGLTELRALGLGYLGLTSLPEGLFADLSMLKALALYYNELTTLPPGIFAGLGELEFLYLYGNNLVTLPDQVFAGCANLEKLNLSDNDLVGLPAGTFEGMISAESINLRDNELTTLPEGLFSGMEDLYMLSLDGNPDLQCVPEAVEGFTSIYRDEELEDIMANGTCECSPAEAVMCGPGTSCEPGNAGYACV